MMQSQHSHPCADEQVWLDFRCFHVGGLLMFIRHQLKRFSFPRRSEMSANRLAWINLKWEEILFLLQNLGHTELLEEDACEFFFFCMRIFNCDWCDITWHWCSDFHAHQLYMRQFQHLLINLVSVVELCHLHQSNEWMFSFELTFLLVCIRLIYFHKLAFLSVIYFLYDPIFSIGLFCWACSFVHVYIKMHFICLKNQSLMSFPCTFWFCWWSFPMQCIKCS